jgi:glutaredoxin 2
MIEQHDITMAYKDAASNNVYIISSAEDSPIVVKVNLSHRVQILEGNDAKTVISYVNSKNREKSVKETKLQDINAWLDESDSSSTTTSQPQSSVQINKKEIKTEEKTNKGEKFSELKRENSLEDLHNSNNLLNFVQVITDPTVGDKVLDALEEIFESKGWGELPDQYTDIDSFLRSKDIPLPKSLEQIDSWLDLIKDCR